MDARGVGTPKVLDLEVLTLVEVSLLLGVSIEVVAMLPKVGIAAISCSCGASCLD